MHINIVFSNEDPEKLQIERAISIINKLQNEYSLQAKAIYPNEFELFLHNDVSFDFWSRRLRRETTEYTIYIISNEFDDNWFSHEERTFSIITTAGWNEYFAPPSVKSYLLYQIAQSLLNFTADISETSFLDQMVHFNATGCANDMCVNKEEIKIGISAGYICPSCRIMFRQYGVSESRLCAVEEILTAARLEAIAKPLPSYMTADEKRVFIVHGHNEKVLDMVSDYVKAIGLTPIVLKRLARNGIDSILNQISENANVMCAILLFTADDKGCEISERKTHKRARQNVVFEAGYFLGRLGKEKVLMMSENDLELPSDLGGCRYINLDQNGRWQRELYEDLKLMGLEPNQSDV